MNTLLLVTCLLSVPLCSTEHHPHHANPNVVRVSLGTNVPPSRSTQFLRQAQPVIPQQPQNAANINNQISCSQTVDVTQVTNTSYHFVVPQNNTANLHCVIIIFGQRGKQLLLQLTEVDLQPGIFDCEYDSVQVYSLFEGKLSFKEK